MTTEEFLEYMNSGKQVTAECGVHQTMHKLSIAVGSPARVVRSIYDMPKSADVL